MPEADHGPDGGARKPATPLAWRAAALVLLFGGLAIGAAASGGGGARLLVIAAIIVVAAGLTPIIVASRRPPVPPQDIPMGPTDDLPIVTVLIAARDEAMVMPTLMDDLGAQDHRGADGRPRFEVIVVDDRSVDGTGAAVLAAAARAGLGPVVRIVRREGPGLKDGKGAALAATTADDYLGGVVVVLDADARIGSDFVRRVALYKQRGVGALTARRRILGGGTSHLAGAQADEQSQDGELQRGRWSSGGCSEFRGNGTVIARDLLAAVGGWPADALTDDIDLASRLAAETGVTVAWALDVEVWEEPVRTWAGLWRQRLRWSEGAIRRYLEHGVTVLRSPRLSLRAKLDFAVYGAQLAAPPLVLGAVIGAVATGEADMAALLAGTYLVAGGVLAFDALRWEATTQGPVPLPDRLGRAVRAALFSGFWLATVPAALWRLATRRGRVRYDKMTHVGHEATTEDAEIAGSTTGEPASVPEGGTR